MEGSSGLHLNNPALGIQIIKLETCLTFEKEENCVCAKAWYRQVLSLLDFYEKSNRSLDHLRPEALTL